MNPEGLPLFMLHRSFALDPRGEFVFDHLRLQDRWRVRVCSHISIKGHQRLLMLKFSVSFAYIHGLSDISITCSRLSSHVDRGRSSKLLMFHQKWSHPIEVARIPELGSCWSRSRSVRLLTSGSARFGQVKVWSTAWSRVRHAPTHNFVAMPRHMCTGTVLARK